jgi:hypothetical protein
LSNVGGVKGGATGKVEKRKSFPYIRCNNSIQIPQYPDVAIAPKLKKGNCLSCSKALVNTFLRHIFPQLKVTKCKISHNRNYSVVDMDRHSD